MERRLIVECWRKNGKRVVLFDAKTGEEIAECWAECAETLAYHVQEEYGNGVAIFVGAKRIDKWEPRH